MTYAEVLAPLPLDSTFTYVVPEALEASVRLFCLVQCPLGTNRYFSGVVTKLHSEAPSDEFKIKELMALIDPRPALREGQLKLWKWIASYYLCTPGEVFKAAMPSALTGDGKSAMPSYKPKTETFIRLSDAIGSEVDLQEVLTSLKKAPQQEKALLEIVASAYDGRTKRSSDHIAFPFPPVPRSALKNVRLSALNALLKRGLILTEQRPVSRLVARFGITNNERSSLTEHQQNAYRQIRETFETKEITLLHGAISSGKTEIYIRLIADTLTQGKQALYLLPELAITTQITARLLRVFGERLLVYHSGCSENERVEVWLRLLSSDEPCLVLGMRSAVFLPFANLGLVVVDEEHEPSYKQQDPAPRYHARNVAMILARMHSAKLLLGSAAPSLETYAWAEKGVYGLVCLNIRYGASMPPEVLIADLKELRRKWRMRNTLFSPVLREKMQQAIAAGEQVILFQNRRGFAPLLICNNCGASPKCPNCDVSLSYHKQSGKMHCHYCGYAIALQHNCSHCGSAELTMMGFGTEKLEEEVAELFPTARIARLDMDSARTQNSFNRIIKDFEEHRTQILIGTQMITKGLDFEGVTLVGVLNADLLLNAPDFRAYERAFQLLMQVSGRAGRRERRGAVVLQTSQADNPLMLAVCNFDYRKMACNQLHERYDFNYPPYKRLIYIVLRSADETLLEQMAELFSEKLLQRFHEGVSAPVASASPRVKAFFVRRIMLKISLASTTADVRGKLKETATEMLQVKGFRKVLVHYDVDPQT